MVVKHLYVLLTMLLAGCSCQEQKAVSLFRFQPEPGKKYEFAVEKISSSGAAGGISGDSLIFQFSLLSKHADSNGTGLRMLIDRFRFVKPRFISHDTALKHLKKSNQYTGMMVKYLAEELQIMEAFAGDSLTLFVNEYGHLIMEDGLDDFIQHVSQKTGLDEGRVKLTVREFLSPSAIKDLFTEIFFYLPAKQVNEKESWVTNTMLSARAPVKYSNMIMLDTVFNNEATLKIKSRISAGGEGNTYMQGNRIGNVTVDLSSGIPSLSSFIDETITHTTGGDIKTKRTFQLTSKLR